MNFFLQVFLGQLRTAPDGAAGEVFENDRKLFLAIRSHFRVYNTRERRYD